MRPPYPTRHTCSDVQKSWGCESEREEWKKNPFSPFSLSSASDNDVQYCRLLCCWRWKEIDWKIPVELLKQAVIWSFCVWVAGESSSLPWRSFLLPPHGISLLLSLSPPKWVSFGYALLMLHETRSSDTMSFLFIMFISCCCCSAQSLSL